MLPPAAPLHELQRRGVDPADVDAAGRAWSLLAVVAVPAAVQPAGHQPDPVRPLPRRQRLDALTTPAVIFAIAALGLNLLTGVAGQVSLGHAFFMGVGAYTARVLGGEAGGRPVGLGPPDLDLAARRRHRRRARRDHRRPGRRPAPRALPRPSSPSAWCSSASTSATRPARRSPATPEVGRNFPPLEFSCGRRRSPSSTSPSDGHWLWFDVTGNAEELPVLRWRCWSSSCRRQEPRPHPHRSGPAGDPRPRRRRRDHGRARVQATR